MTWKEIEGTLLLLTLQVDVIYGVRIRGRTGNILPAGLPWERE